MSFVIDVTEEERKVLRDIVHDAWRVTAAAGGSDEQVQLLRGLYGKLTAPP